MKKLKRIIDCNRPFKIIKNCDAISHECIKNQTKSKNSNENLAEISKNLMEKEELHEKHLQDAIKHNLSIPVPDIVEISKEDYDKLYPANHSIPKIRVMIQPKNEVIEYDADSEDEKWLKENEEILKLTYDDFEKYMEYLENSSDRSKKVPTLSDFAKNFNMLSLPMKMEAVYDYWLNKRIKANGMSFLYSLKRETSKSGMKNKYDPYVAFRPCRERMHLRKNRAKDYENYVKMLKLRDNIEEYAKFYKTSAYCESTKHELLKLRFATFKYQYYTKGFDSSYLEKEAFCNTEFLLKDLKENRIGNDVDRRDGEVKLIDTMDTMMDIKKDDGEMFEFRRLEGCEYHQILNNTDEFSCTGDQKDVFYSTYLGIMRRRMGRGGRIIYDRTISNSCSLIPEYYQEVDFHTESRSSSPLPLDCMNDVSNDMEMVCTLGE